MDHVTVPLDAAHARLVTELGQSLAAAVGCPGRAVPARPHLTVASYRGLTADAAVAALGCVAATVGPFTVRAHGYGMFTGTDPNDLSLHIMVVRTAELDDLHTRVRRALRQAGAEAGGLTDPDVWTPHITLLEAHLTPARLGRAVELLAAREHRSWTIAVDALAVGVGRGRRWSTGIVRLGSAVPPA